VTSANASHFTVKAQNVHSLNSKLHMQKQTTKISHQKLHDRYRKYRRKNAQLHETGANVSTQKLLILYMNDFHKQKFI